MLGPYREAGAEVVVQAGKNGITGCARKWPWLSCYSHR